jgi:hypothetical protein
MSEMVGLNEKCDERAVELERLIEKSGRGAWEGERERERERVRRVRRTEDVKKKLIKNV